MNTQRPEWNDANNALVGNGLSMVTLCHLRRYLRFLETLADGAGDRTVSISTEVADWYGNLRSILDENRALLTAASIDDRSRKRLLDALGRGFSEYREKVYSSGFSGKTTVSVAEIAEFCGVALEYLDHAVRANRREDGLYHSYNLLEISKDGKTASIDRMYEMLEGQVAALSSGVVDADEAVRLLSALFESGMYRGDQRSFMLYPERTLPGFLEKNIVPDETVRAVPLLRELVESGEGSVLARDVLGVCRFNADFRNALDLASALDRLARQERWTEPVARDRQAVLDAFESVFNHRSFTGRSGTMYGYEGLGCIYWHMVSKLLLAVQEVIVGAVRGGESEAVLDALVKIYFRIRGGLGFEKKVAEYGAFPTDPYSHTPRHAGAQQPGMTGQVKEEILARFGELGVQVEGGTVGFRPILLRKGDFLGEAGTYVYYDLEGVLRSIAVPAGRLAFSFCQVPVVYEPARKNAWIRVTLSDGSMSTSSTLPGSRLDADQSRAIFDRLGTISRIDVGVPEQWLWA